MTWSARDIPSQHGRVAVVTGANGGLGLATARALAARGAHVVMAARNQAKADAARGEILATVPKASLEIVPLDLGSLASVAAAAKAVLDRHDRLDLLVNNAGVMAMPEGTTEDGFEVQLGINHLGHWALTSHLLTRLVATPGARVVSVTSVAQHQGQPLDLDNPFLHGRYEAWRAYGNSKLANRHFIMGLHDRFQAAGVDTIAVAAHPGLTNSDLQTATVEAAGGGWRAGLFHRMTTTVGMSIDRGALSQLRAATDPQATGGTLYGPAYVFTGPPVLKPLLRPGADAAIATLWEVSRRETGLDIDVEATVRAA